MQIASSSEGGFTLVEVLVALVIMLVGLVGLLQSVNVATEHNIKNLLRDEAVRVGEEKMYEARNTVFTSLSGHSARPVARTFRGATKNFNVSRTVTNFPTGSSYLTATSKKVDIAVSWGFKGVNLTHEVTSVVAQ